MVAPQQQQQQNMSTSNHSSNPTNLDVFFSLLIVGGTTLIGMELYRVLRLKRTTLEEARNVKKSINVAYQDTNKHLGNAMKEIMGGNTDVKTLDRCVTPTKGLESMVLAPEIKESLQSIMEHTKVNAVLFDKWGFNTIHRATKGVSAMFCGILGTGKTMAAEALAFDLGRPLLVVNVANLLGKYLGESEKNIQAVFDEATKRNAVLVFDEAEGLFASRSTDIGAIGRVYSLCVGLLLQNIENHPGISIVITNLKEAIDVAFFRRFRFVLDFEMPDATQREHIWKASIPDECPLASNVSLGDLATKYETTGGDIKNALLNAATRAALRPSNDNDNDDKKKEVTMDDFTFACNAEVSKKKKPKDEEVPDKAQSMYS